ncbi:hypothetical protein F5883DRAFT_107090 [Diaporthe sp. PMI_573]|nr:hypothetical protein F5883DRAFT_107090 [Diaporthaceae sp. PMI_573]
MVGAHGRRGERGPPPRLLLLPLGLRRRIPARRRQLATGRGSESGDWQVAWWTAIILHHRGESCCWIKVLITEFMTWLGVPDTVVVATILAGLEFLACCSTGYEEYVESNMPRRYSIRYHVKRPHAVFNWRAISKRSYLSHPFVYRASHDP